jgi:hypothetical protein
VFLVKKIKDFLHNKQPPRRRVWCWGHQPASKNASNKKRKQVVCPSLARGSWIRITTPWSSKPARSEEQEQASSQAPSKRKKKTAKNKKKAATMQRASSCYCYCLQLIWCCSQTKVVYVICCITITNTYYDSR